MTPDTAPLDPVERDELIYLRSRVQELERELTEQAARANAAVAAAQERAYWLDRWHLDLNAVVERPAVERARGAARVLRGPVRQARLLKRRLLG